MPLTSNLVVHCIPAEGSCKMCFAARIHFLISLCGPELIYGDLIYIPEKTISAENLITSPAVSIEFRVQSGPWRGSKDSSMDHPMLGYFEFVRTLPLAFPLRVNPLCP